MIPDVLSICALLSVQKRINTIQCFKDSGRQPGSSMVQPNKKM